MGIFDGFRRKKPEQKSAETKRETPPRGEQVSPGGWQVGDRILNRYEIHDVKWGGMGIVYIAFDSEWNQIFAIKTFQDKYLRDEDAIDRFMNEAETWVNLERHTNIVFANFVQKIEGKPCIFLEYIDGGDLSHYIGRLDIPHGLDFAIQLCNGMDYACRQLGVIHRDIKPQNAMITAEGVLKVTDFGLVKALGQRMTAEELGQGSPIVSRGMGTLAYMPPEQFPEEIQRGFHFPLREVTTRSDIYSFGVTFYQALTGSLPLATIEHIFTQKPTNPANLNPSIPRQLDLLLMKCLEKDPARRYGSFEELRGELIEIYHALPEEQRVFGERYVVKGKKEPLTAIDWGNKGVSLDALGKPQEAIACYDRVLEIDPRDAGAWSNKGVALGTLGRYDEAIACLDRALEIDPRDAKAWSNKGLALRNLGRHKEVIACLDRALEIDPGYAEAWSNKGVTLGALGRRNEAITSYDRALEIDPRSTIAWSNKGLALGALGRYQEAMDCHDRALEIDPRDAVVWGSKGNALGNLGRYQEAIDCLDRALEINPRSALAWSNKGLALGALGRHKEAIISFRKFIELAPPKYGSHVGQVKEFIRQLEQKI